MCFMLTFAVFVNTGEKQIYLQYVGLRTFQKIISHLYIKLLWNLLYVNI